MSKTHLYHLKNFVWLIATLVALAGLCLFILSTLGGNIRALNPWSNLKLYEEGITAVSNEFMRRSPRLTNNYERFQECMRFEKCSEEQLSALLDERDQIIHQEWPTIFDRLIVSGDWAVKDKPLTNEEIAARKAYLDFQAKLSQLGQTKMRDACVPIIYFWITSKTHETEYGLDRNQGYQCTGDPTPPKQRFGR